MFRFPKIHSFPPFYTKQQNATILENQLEEWANLILSYCQYYSIYSLLPLGTVLSQQMPQDSLPELFENKQIERTAGADFRKDIFNHLIHKRGCAAYIDPKKPESGILIYWRTLSEWAKLLCDYVDSTGQIGSVLTVYELTKLEDTGDEVGELRNLDTVLLGNVLDLLAKQGKVQILNDPETNEIAGFKVI